MRTTRRDRAGRPPRGGRRAGARHDAAAGQMAIAYGGAAGAAAGGTQYRLARRPTGRPRRRHGQCSSPAGAAPEASILPPTQPPSLCPRSPPPRQSAPALASSTRLTAWRLPRGRATRRRRAAASAPTATSYAPRRPTAPSFLPREAAPASAAPAALTPLRLPMEGGPRGAAQTKRSRQGRPRVCYGRSAPPWGDGCTGNSGHAEEPRGFFPRPDPIAPAVPSSTGAPAL